MRQSAVRTIRSRPCGGAIQLGIDSAGGWNNHPHSRIARRDRSLSTLKAENAPSTELAQLAPIRRLPASLPRCSSLGRSHQTGWHQIEMQFLNTAEAIAISAVAGYGQHAPQTKDPKVCPKTFLTKIKSPQRSPCQRDPSVAAPRESPRRRRRVRRPRSGGMS